MPDPSTLPVARLVVTLMQRLGHSFLERVTSRMPWGELLQPLLQELRDTMRQSLLALGQHLAAVAEQSVAGALPLASPCAARTGDTHAQPVRADGALALPPPPGGELAPVPRAFAWFARLSPHARCTVSDMRPPLEGPERATPMASHPGSCRIIRPLCHRPGIRRHPHMIAFQPLPKRARTPEARYDGYRGCESAVAGTYGQRCAKND